TTSPNQINKMWRGANCALFACLNLEAVGATKAPQNYFDLSAIEPETVRRQFESLTAGHS
ncbi:MAG: hypothetical protein Q8M07_20105, partial [Prosthecobacter sp.]|nr:hypothetical protein [Prosthecobacter sp.]